MRHLPARQALNLNRLLQGHYAYFGVAELPCAAHRAVERYWRKMLSNKGHISWDVFHQIKARHPLQRPRLRLPLGSCKQRISLRRAAGNPHAPFCGSRRRVNPVPGSATTLVYPTYAYKRYC